MKGGLKPCDLPPMEEDWRRTGGGEEVMHP